MSRLRLLNHLKSPPLRYYILLLSLGPLFGFILILLLILNSPHNFDLPIDLAAEYCI